MLESIDERMPLAERLALTSKRVAGTRQKLRDAQKRLEISGEALRKLARSEQAQEASPFKS